MKADNAVIIAAGTSSRFAPLSYEMPKGLTVVRGEVLIERQIRQLREAGVDEIIVVTGYKSEQFEYLRAKFNVILINNPDYLSRNNNASIYAAKAYFRNTYLCACDNYFIENPFLAEPDCTYYAAEYADGETSEWCMEPDENGDICKVTVGGSDSWYMMGQAFWSEEFSRKYISILESIYDEPETTDMYWEDVMIQNTDVLKMKIRKYQRGLNFEFDTLDELRIFDESYVDDTRSQILKSLALKLGCRERDFMKIHSFRTVNNAAAGFRFELYNRQYEYCYEDESVKLIGEG